MTVGGDSLSHICVRCGFDHGGERTPKSHRYLMVICAIAAANWPHGREPHPDCAAQLRAWLFAHPAVNFASTIEGPFEAAPQFEEIMEQMRLRGMRFFLQPKPDAGTFVLRVPRSGVSAAKGGARRGEWYSLIDRVLALIEAETGMNRADLRREGLAAVAPRPRLGKRKAA